MQERTILKWPGSKSRMAHWIIAHMPPHRVYLEPFCGSGAVFFAKPKAACEILNDRNGEIVNLFRVLRTQPEELVRLISFTPYARDEYTEAWAGAPPEDPVAQARRFLVMSWQSMGYTSGGWRVTRSANAAAASVWKRLPDRLVWAALRLKDAHIDNLPALDVLEKSRDRDVLVYADPPYPLSTRHKEYYPDEMTDAEHLDLLVALDRHPGPVLLSGYRCGLYDGALSHWKRLDHEEMALTAETRTECLWLNRAAALAGQGRLEL